MLHEIQKRAAEMKANDIVHLSCQSNIFHTLFFWSSLVMGFFSRIARIIFPNGALMPQSVSLTGTVKILYLRRDIDGQYRCDCGRKIAFCVLYQYYYIV